MAQKTFFARTSSGLVREFGTLDTLLIASAAVFALTYTILQFPFYYGFNPGANLPLALVITGIPFVFLMMVYWAMGVIMPRSGNDYVWVARILHPAAGFAWSFLYMFSVFATAYVGGVAAYASGISTALTVWGFLYNSQGLVAFGTYLSSPTGGYALSILITVCFAVLAIAGAKAVRGFLYVAWALAVIGIIVMWGVVASTSPAAFAAKWDSVLGQYSTYAGLTTLATKNGWSPPTITLAASLASAPFAALFLLGGNFANVVAGEIKNVKRAIPVALLLSLILGIIIWSITAQLTLNNLGENWMYAVGYLWDNAPAAYSSAMPLAPTYPMMVSLIAYPNQFMVFLVLFTMLAGSLTAPFVYFWIPSRYFFAWSFDRIIPTKMADVSKRFRTPHISIITITIMSIIILALYWFTSWPTAETIGTFLWAFCFVVPGIATTIFPFTKKDMLDAAPGWMRKKLGGVPVISILGLLTTISFFYIGYLALINPLIVTLTTAGAGIAVGIIVACIIIYYASVYYHKKHGLDIELAFKEIPPV
jgi:APA family basic amino acid/polyamine antiporter